MMDPIVQKHIESDEMYVGYYESPSDILLKQDYGVSTFVLLYLNMRTHKVRGKIVLGVPKVRS